MNELLDYSSWSFQIVFFLVVMYLVVGLVQPKWVLATRRSTIVIVSVLLLLIGSTAFYIATLPLDSAPDGTHRTSTELEPTVPER